MTDWSKTCPLCGGHNVVGAHLKPSKAGEWCWACKDCRKSWVRDWFPIFDEWEVEKP